MCPATPRRSLRAKKRPDWFSAGRPPTTDRTARLRARATALAGSVAALRRRLKREASQAERKLRTLRAWHDEVAFVHKVVQRDELAALFKQANVPATHGTTAKIGAVCAVLAAKDAEIAALKATIEGLGDGSLACVYCGDHPTPSSE